MRSTVAIPRGNQPHRGIGDVGNRTSGISNLDKLPLEIVAEGRGAGRGSAPRGGCSRKQISVALEAGWKGLDIAEIVPLNQIAHAHELVEHPVKPGRVIVSIS